MGKNTVYEHGISYYETSPIIIRLEIELGMTQY